MKSRTTIQKMGIPEPGSLLTVITNASSKGQGKPTREIPIGDFTIKRYGQQTYLIAEKCSFGGGTTIVVH